jgi:hypothetical protein
MEPELLPGGDRGLLQRVPTPAPARRVRHRWRWVLTGERPEPQPSFIGVIEDPDESAVGICCSGGGIRSAAFNLGALQALQQRRSSDESDTRSILQGARYVAAVSGGSYIAAGFSMVAKRWPGNGDRPGKNAEGHDDSDPGLFDEQHPPFHPGSPEEQYLRNRSSYLAPDGLRKLLLGYRVFLGLVFNLLFLGLALFAVGVALGSLVYRPLYGALADPNGNCIDLRANACQFAADIPNGFLWLLVALGAAILVDGLLLLLLRPRRDSVRRILETWATRLMLLTAALAVILVAIPVLAEVMLNYGNEQGGSRALETASAPTLPAVGAGSFATVLLAILLQLRAHAAEPATVLQTVKGARGVWRRLGMRARLAVVYVAGAIAGPLLLLAMLVFAASLTLSYSDASHTDTTMVLVGAGALAGFVVLYFLADLNTWSLHPFYRRRLCTAFALKRVTGPDGRPMAKERKYSNLVPLSESGVEPRGASADWPTLIVCAAANVSDPGATPPGRGVTSFTFSANAIGGPLVGAAETVDYEEALGSNRQRDITLPAAVAMSGAALSPSMGKLTRRPFTFLMALANVRLGVWIPNPRYVEGWRQRGLIDHARRDVWKLPRPKYLFRELLGRNRLDARFIYVSDGGHYENLGLVELLRRGCTKIYCFDASGGVAFTALGDAVALARSELQVEVDIDPRPLVATGERNLAERDCVCGTIRYPPADDGTPGLVGTLVYARTVMTEGVPWDVHAYHEADPTFPHHSTADQLYTDQKFEAYRELGWSAGHRAVKLMDTPTTLPGPADPEPAVVSGNGSNGDRTVASWPLGGRFRVEVHEQPAARR